MDTIRFEIGKREDPSDGVVDAVNILVNHRNLVDILREVELPFRVQEGRPHFASKYVGLPPQDIFLPSPRLLDEPATFYDHDYPGKIAVLGCGCGDVGCWPLLVEISLRDDVVVCAASSSRTDAHGATTSYPHSSSTELSISRLWIGSRARTPAPARRT